MPRRLLLGERKRLARGARLRAGITARRQADAPLFQGAATWVLHAAATDRSGKHRHTTIEAIRVAHTITISSPPPSFAG
jgi:hypothetical protein